MEGFAVAEGFAVTRRAALGYVDVPRSRPPVVDVVLLSGPAAVATAGDFGVDPDPALGGGWLAVASQAGTVVGVAFAYPRRGALDVSDLAFSEHADRTRVNGALLEVLRPLAPGGRTRVTAPARTLGLRERVN